MAPTETRQFAGEQAGRLLRGLAFEIGQTARSCNPEAVHDVRVAIRRFTQTIVVLKPCFPGKDIRRIRRRLKKIMVAAGEVRDCDLTLKFIAKSNVTDAIPLQSKLQRQRKESSRILVRELERCADRRVSLKWRTAVEAALAGNEDAFGEDPIHETSRRALWRMGKDFLKHGNEAASSEASPEELHQFRLAAKKFRYTLELFAPLYGSSLNRGVARIKHAQTLLGAINDCVTVAGMIAPYNAGNMMASRLRKRQRKKTEEFRQYWNVEFRDEELQSWLDQVERPGPIRKPIGSSRAIPHRKSDVA